jgi:hypothetical protein
MMIAMAFSSAARTGELTVYTSFEEDDTKVYLDALAKAGQASR